MKIIFTWLKHSGRIRWLVSGSNHTDRILAKTIIDRMLHVISSCGRNAPSMGPEIFLGESVQFRWQFTLPLSQRSSCRPTFKKIKWNQQRKKLPRLFCIKTRVWPPAAMLGYESSVRAEHILKLLNCPNVSAVPKINLWPDSRHQTNKSIQIE